MSGRVTIACERNSQCDSEQPDAATEHHCMLQAPGRGNEWQCFVCDRCAVDSRALDAAENFAKTKRRPSYHRVINPGTCSESDVLAAECAMDAIARLLRCFDRAVEIDGKLKTLRRDEADVARLRAAAEAVRGRYYERCRGVYHGYDREWKLRPSHWEPDDMCLQCHGTGLVLRRRSDGTAVIDEIDAGSVAA